MIGENLRETVIRLFDEGKAKKEIARFLGINIKTVRQIIARGDEYRKSRNDKIIIDYDLLLRVYERCRGYKQRMYEILKEEYNMDIGYSTLTRLVREYGLGRAGKERSGDYPDIPGAEMQHDTSEYILSIGTRKRKVIASGLYFRYSKMRYVIFYYKFNRFAMKCFFHKALTFFGYTALTCIIDNTNLAVYHGTGKNAVFAGEMISFAGRYGFEWKAHAIGHSNRKAGKERNFFTLETNFFPGRTFGSLDDLNSQAFQWATERFANRPQSKTRLIPCELFELEKPYLKRLPGYIEPPYREHFRKIDTYGYVAFDGNYYWVPEGIMGQAKLIEYADTINIYQNHTKLITYDTAQPDVKNEKIVPPGMKNVPYQPVHREKGCAEEEKRLIAMDPSCASYIAFVKSPDCSIPHKPKFIRQLYRFSKKMSPSLFFKCIRRAHEYSIARMDSIEAIARQLFLESSVDPPAPPFCADYEGRPEYQKGRFSYETDLKDYSKLLREGNDE